MAKFTDAKGREWEFRPITTGDLDDLARLGLDVEAVVDDFDKLGPAVARPRAFAQLLWWFVGDAVARANVDAAEFNRGLSGDAQYRAVVAIRDAIIEFFPHPPAAKARAIARLTEATAAAEAAAAAATPAGPTGPSGGGSAAASPSSPASSGSTPAA